MFVRLIMISEVKVGMVTLEQHGRGVVTRSHPAYGENGWFYEYRQIDGKWKGETGNRRAVLDNTVWIEDPEQGEGVRVSKEWMNRLADRLREAPDLNEPREVAELLELATGKRTLENERS